MSLTNTVQAFAAENQCVAGICDASPLAPSYLGAGGFVPFVSKDINKRTNPKAVFPAAQSIIAIGVAIELWQHPMDTETEDNSHTYPQAKYGTLSSIGTTLDYHPRVKALLSELARAVVACHPKATYKMLADSPTLDERAFAQRAGIGFVGRSGLLISPQYGTRFNIGLLITDIPPGSPPPTAPTPSRACPQGCNLCIKACPNNALAQDTPLNTGRCISYLTQKPNLAPEEEPLLKGALYGCDICQDVCPFNEGKPKASTCINLEHWLNMSDEDFQKKYAHTAMLWQGAHLLRRNALIAMSRQTHEAFVVG